MKGTVTTNGCRFYAVADYDSTLVARYKAAGLNIFGKTSPEFSQTATTESCSTVRHSTPGTANLALADPPAVRRRGRRWHLARGACQ